MARAAARALIRALRVAVLRSAAHGYVAARRAVCAARACRAGACSADSVPQPDASDLASEHSCAPPPRRAARARARAAPTRADLYDMAQSQGVTCLTVSFVGEDARNAAIVSAPPSGEPGGSVRWTYSSRMMRAASSSKPRRTWT